MAWTAPMTAVANATFTAAQFNQYVRDNLNETAPAKATTDGRIFVATGTNTIAERLVGRGSVTTTETTTSTSFTDLTTAGPASTLTTSTIAIAIISARCATTSAGATAEVGVEVTGASSVSASSDFALVYESGAASDQAQMSYVTPLTVSAGSNTFTLKYRVSAGTGSFGRRRLIVLPFG